MVKLGTFKDGLKGGIPICLAYLAVSFSFGLKVSQMGFSAFFATLVSGTNLTSAGQFAGMEIIKEGVSLLTLFFAVLIINSRYLLMSLSLTQSLNQNISFAKRLAMSFFVTDEIFALANYNKKRLSFPYFMGIAFAPYFGWVIGTLLGCVVNNLLPESVQNAMGIALYCMFIAIVLPTARTEKPVAFCMVLSIAFSCLFYYVPFLSQISFGITIIIVSLISAVICSLLFPHKKNDTDCENDAEEVSL